jgi:hypothetical protein
MLTLLKKFIYEYIEQNVNNIVEICMRYMLKHIIYVEICIFEIREMFHRVGREVLFPRTLFSEFLGFAKPRNNNSTTILKVLNPTLSSLANFFNLN